MKLLEVTTGTSDQQAEIKKVILHINSKCGKYIKSLGGWERIIARKHNLYRGMKIDEPYGTKMVRSDRIPKDTRTNIHHDIDAWFDSEFGHPYRSNAMFATGSWSDATSYGRLYNVFPIGEYNFVYSEHIKDLWDDIETTMVDLDLELEEDEPELLDNVQQILNQGRYQENGKIEDAITSDSEIMIACKSYVFVRESIYNDDMVPMIKQMIKAGELK